MNNVTKHIIYLLSNSDSPVIIIRNWIIHNSGKTLNETKTMEYVNNQNYDLDEARKKSLIMLKNSPHLKCKGPKSLYLNNNVIPNSRVYAYLGELNGQIMYTKYTLNNRNKDMLIFNSWHKSIYPNDPRFAQLY